jgi:hypothetical protein
MRLEVTMPYISDWEIPGVAFLVDGYPIHLVYRNDACSNQDCMLMEHSYQILPDGADPWDTDAWFVFCIDELPEYTKAMKTKDEDSSDSLFEHEEDRLGFHKHIIKMALVSGSLAKSMGEKIIFPLTEDTWPVDVTRISSRTTTILVKARSVAEAEEKAIEEAGNHDFNQHSESEPEYKSEIRLWPVD